MSSRNSAFLGTDSESSQSSRRQAHATFVFNLNSAADMQDFVGKRSMFRCGHFGTTVQERVDLRGLYMWTGH